MAGVFTWIRQWRAGDGAGPGAPVPGPAGEPTERAGEEIPGDTQDPDPPLPEPGGGPRGGNDIASPRDVLPERPPTVNDLVLYFMHSVFGSDLALKRFLKVLTRLAVIGVVGYAAVWVVSLVIHVLFQKIAPGSAPSLGSLKWSVTGLGSGTALVFGGLRIRRWRKSRGQRPAIPPPGTAEEAGERQP
ncbi:hypothetical protein J2Z21_001778 [Streptomyces griseochromogenes]|uniref:Uncharacterized protein n=1 Tax=Streptomyces griseochromogenes TaxID=68214 RepID=A0A1B1B771_9ACTN|nr:hypothetical protein [Streptomyces griseochromogenes]ANP54611.1 hypothetical protein AVL59_37955 [Streptomyces griseochromogenes]MBP2048853.1 hypothetical protein [Streptomyces griseochromogenes]